MFGLKVQKLGVLQRRALAAKLTEGIVVTTAYSGLGTIEVVCRQVIEEMALALHVEPTLHFYSACEIDECARKTLLAHSAKTKVEHLFGDALCLACGACRVTLDAKQPPS